MAHYRAGQPTQALRLMRCAMLADPACVPVAYNFCVLLCRGELVSNGGLRLLASMVYCFVLFTAQPSLSLLPFFNLSAFHGTCIQLVHPTPQC